jgi:hypothetical protein
MDATSYSGFLWPSAGKRRIDINVCREPATPAARAVWRDIRRRAAWVADAAD